MNTSNVSVRMQALIPTSPKNSSLTDGCLKDVFAALDNVIGDRLTGIPKSERGSANEWSTDG